MAIKRCPADTAFSKAMRLSRPYCEFCGKIDSLENCHIYGRRNKAVRWDSLNCVVMCHHHHRVFTENPLDFRAWLVEYLGQGYLDILCEKKNRIQKTNVAYRKDVAKHYRAEIKLLEAGPHTLVSYQ